MSAHVVEIEPTVNVPYKRRLVIFAVRSSSAEPDAPIDECQYSIMGSSASAVWVKVSSLRPFITSGKIIS